MGMTTYLADCLLLQYERIELQLAFQIHISAHLILHTYIQLKVTSITPCREKRAYIHTRSFRTGVTPSSTWKSSSFSILSSSCHTFSRSPRYNPIGTVVVDQSFDFWRIFQGAHPPPLSFRTRSSSSWLPATDSLSTRTCSRRPATGAAG